MTTHGEGRGLAFAEFTKRHTSFPSKWVWNRIRRGHLFSVWLVYAHVAYKAKISKVKRRKNEKIRTTANSEESADPAPPHWPPPHFVYGPQIHKRKCKFNFCARSDPVVQNNRPPLAQGFFFFFLQGVTAGFWKQVSYLVCFAHNRKYTRWARVALKPRQPFKRERGSVILCFPHPSFTFPLFFVLFF